MWVDGCGYGGVKGGCWVGWWGGMVARKAVKVWGTRRVWGEEGSVDRAAVGVVNAVASRSGGWPSSMSRGGQTGWRGR